MQRPSSLGSCAAFPLRALFRPRSSRKAANLARSDVDPVAELELADRLRTAVEADDVPTATALLGRGVSPDRRDLFRHACTCLHVCRSKEMAEVLIQHGASIEARNELEETPLMRSTRDARLADVTRALLAHGADARARDGNGFTALHGCESEEVAEMLALAGAEIDAVSVFRRQTPLLFVVDSAGARNKASDPAFLKLLGFLLDKGADPNARDSRGFTALHTCQSAEMADLLIRRGANVKAKSPNGDSVLNWSVHHTIARERLTDPGYAAMIARFLEEGADPTVTDWGRGDTALHSCPNQAIAEALLGSGANINATRSRGETPLMSIASLAGSRNRASDPTILACVEHLLSKGADLHARDESGRTPLFFCESREMAELMVSWGADVHARTLGGSTVLAHCVCISHALGGNPKPGFVEMARFLMERGVDPCERDARGAVALHECRSKVMAEILLQGGNPQVDVLNNLQETPLMSAMVGVDKRRDESEDDSVLTEFLDFLLEKGANPNARNEQGWTPLHFYPSEKMTAILLRRGADLEDNRGVARQTPLFRAVLEMNELQHDLQSSKQWIFASHVLRAGRANLEARDGRGNTCLHVCHNRDVAELLVRAGANVHAENALGDTVLLAVTRHAQSPGRHALLRYLLENGASPTRVGLSCTPCLHWCRTSAEVDAMMEFGADIDARDDLGATPLIHTAIRARGLVASEEVAQYVGLVKCLLRHGANPRAKSKDGWTSLHYCRHLQVLRTLLEHGAEINVSSVRAGSTPLHEAVACATQSASCLPVLRCLLEQGANTRVKDAEGQTPLHLCTHLEWSQLLVSHGADVNALNNNGETPLFYMVKRARVPHIVRHPEFYPKLRFLLQAGAKVHSARISKSGEDMIASCRDERTIRLLKSRGIDSLVQ